MSVAFLFLTTNYTYVSNMFTYPECFFGLGFCANSANISCSDAVIKTSEVVQLSTNQANVDKLMMTNSSRMPCEAM